MSPNAYGDEPSVLIVGGGPVGLSLAIELRGWGIDVTIVERREPDRLTHPTANHLSVRTMELLRRWGLADQTRAAGFPTDRDGAVSILTHVGGFELVHVPRPSADDPERRLYTPETELWQPKRFFDPVLRAAAVERGARLLSGVEVIGIEPDASGVTARLRDAASGAERVLRAGFVVGCDGAASRVREWLGLALEGFPPDDAIESIYFRSAELTKRLPENRWQYRILGTADGPDPHGWMVVAIDGVELWRLHGPGLMVPGSPEATAENLRRVLGKDIDVEVRSMLPWQPRQAICPTFRLGRVFLAGDAAARGTTYGGLWLNRGIADAMDLGWKLAAAVEGWGGARLLDSYSIERRQATLDLLRHQGVDLSGDRPVRLADIPLGHRGILGKVPREFWNDDPEGAELRRVVREKFGSMPAEATEVPRADLGYRYDGSPVISDEGESFDQHDEWRRYEQSAKPGGRAPHVALADGSSTLDWVGRRFTVVECGSDGTPICTAAEARGVPIHRVEGRDAAVRAAYDRPLTLVRPDGFVAWQGDVLDREGAERVIDLVRGA